MRGPLPNRPLKCASNSATGELVPLGLNLGLLRPVELRLIDLRHDDRQRLPASQSHQQRAAIFERSSHKKYVVFGVINENGETTRKRLQFNLPRQPNPITFMV